ncbi:AAA domain-containing protein [Rothia mucilaginosa]|uniref:DEAD/DEAH box helicase n=1 Tax=Rothia mucilaginosa TaxID=43675 RepID=UPI0028E3531D|nr:AAA domain-containing protein [Rothia mucilaginosa]
MDLTFTLTDLTATSACELRLYTELRERVQNQSVYPTPEKSERAREAYRECLRVLTEGGMVGCGVVSGEHAGGTARPVPLVATSAAGLTYTVELDRLDCPATDSTAEGNTARIVCTPHLGEAAHRALLRGTLAAHLLTANATESTENAENVRRLDLHLEHGANEYCAGSESEPSEHHSPVPQPHRVDSVRILPLIRLQEQRLLLLTQALNEGVEPAELAERIPHFLTCDECPACLNSAASLALATDAPELIVEDTAEDATEDRETEEHPVMYRVPAAVENDSEQYHLQCLLDAQLASLEEHAAEHGWGAGELEAAMLLSMTNYHRRERAPFWREHIRRLEDGPTAWVASRDYAYLDRVQVLSVEHAHALLNTPADLEALAAAMKEPTEVPDAPGWYRVRGAQVRLLRARIEADPSLVIAPSNHAVFCAYEAGSSPQIALDRMESQVNYFRASNPGERVPAELAATGFFGMRVLAVAQGGFGAGSEGSANPEEAAAESGKSTGESAGEFLEVLLQERIRVKDEPHRALPSGIGPGDPVSTATIEAALQSDVHGLLFGGALMPNDSVLNDPVPGEDSEASSESAETPDPSRTLPSVLDAAASLTGVKSASADLLFRRAPRLKKGASNAKNAENLPLEVDFPGSALPTVDAVHAAVRALDRSYVAVQGPPGAGKTFLASHVIARLVAEGAKVGVVAQSHAVIENLMVSCCARDGFDVSRAVRLRGKSVTPDAPWSEVSDSELVELISGAGGLLFGGTVWDYVSERRVPAGSLDVLVVDEAGQFSLTNTVAAARAARSVLLLGDPQQLPQVSTGVHPYPVDVSALGWLSDGAAALDPRFGYFLGESWRMDSALCERVSWLSYDGALASAAATAGRALQGVVPGVVSYPVEHSGCSVRSVQEAQAVVDCVRELLGREWVPATDAEPRPLAAEDCIVVAAYNAQVDCVREALIAAGLADSSGAGVRVGTVDKFQGQEAAVVLVSLASSRVDSGRGAGFVLSPNRLNVAVSRGQWQAVLVHSPWVARSVPQDVEEVLALSGFAGLVE